MTTESTPTPETSDTRIAYGAQCTWWGPIQDVGTKPMALKGSARETRVAGRTLEDHFKRLPIAARQLPCCPHCNGPLFEMDSEADWLAHAEQYAIQQHDPQYVTFMQWAKGRCFRTLAEARLAFAGRERTP